MKRLFHYTKACHLSSICQEGSIRLATKHVQYDRPAVWCSTREDFEPTSAVGKFVGGRVRPMSQEQMAAVPPFNPVRIEVKPTCCPFEWWAFKRLSGIRPQLARALEIIGREQGADPNNWYAGFVPIDAEDWLMISYYVEGEWLVMPTSSEVINKLAGIPFNELRSFFQRHGVKSSGPLTMQTLVAQQ